MIRKWWTRHWRELTVGLCVAVIMVGLHASGLTRRLELLGYDVLVRHFSDVPASDDIVHIDIDDDSLIHFKRWPWPRDVQAELVRILTELDAAQIVLDITYTERQPIDLRPPLLDEATVLEELPRIGALISAQDVFDPDGELARAIADATEICLPFYQREWSTPLSPALQQGVALLVDDFSMTATDIAGATGASPDAVSAHFAEMKRQAARSLVGTVLDENPLADRREIHERILHTPFDRITADRKDVLDAYDHVKGVRALRERMPELPKGLEGRVAVFDEMVPPLFTFTNAADRVGLVGFEPDQEDGLARHVSLLGAWQGRVVEQLGLAVARSTTGMSIDELSTHAAGRTLIPWHVAPSWQECFVHVPVMRLCEIYDVRRAMQDNNRRRELLMDEAVLQVSGEAGLAERRRECHELALLRHQGDAASAELLEARIKTNEADLVQLVREEWAVLQEEPDPNDPEIAEDYARFREAHALIANDVQALEAVNSALDVEAMELLDGLRPMIAGRVCFVGYTATALADMVSTPAYARLPGVMVHSQVYNSLVQGESRSSATLPTQLMIVFAAGVIATGVTCLVGVTSSFLIVLLLIAGAFSVNAWVVFERFDHWLPMVTALVSVFVTWAIVLMFRLLVTDRQKRRFSRAVAQYVSPAMARQISEEVDAYDLSPREQVVTCFFSDLAGFTRMSERLGPEQTRAVLNPYLDAMSGVFHHHSALINKFMGDGIFAFFNAPILPCDRHPRAACEAALDQVAALRELIRRHETHPLADAFAALSMRIGITSGKAFVGDYGSENKLDYTCVGDTVNLASRLESANKQFGTTIVAARAIRQAAGDGFVFRSLGRVVVVGQSVPVQVDELIGRADEVPAERRAESERFEHGVDAFARRDFSTARDIFGECAAKTNSDLLAKRYRDMATELLSTSPPDDWDGALYLTDK